MPTYEYQCEECGHRFERFQNMSDEPVQSCPRCSGRVQRLIGMGSAVLFRGRGFYKTDYERRHSSTGPRCGRDQTCCGRDTRCDSSPCER